jgi:hypothetical protein
MQATNRKNMHTDEFSKHKVKSTLHVRNMKRPTLLLSILLVLSLLLVCSTACAPAASPNDSKQSDPASSTDVPELTDEMIRDRINYRRVRQIPEENGAAEPIGWTFFENEPKEIRIVEKKIEGNRATVLLDIKTQSASNAREPRQLAGQIRTEWLLETGWVMRQWEIVETENISMKYKNLPKPPQNSNR